MANHNLILGFILGVIFGSFNNVLIYRLPRNESIFGRSRCTYCAKQLSWSQNVPLISYLALKGKCGNCQKNIGIKYPIIELTTGLLCSLTFLGNATPIIKFAFFCFTFVGIAISVIDWNYHKIPNKLNLNIFLILISLLTINSMFTGEFKKLIFSLVIAIASGIIFLAISILSQGGLGLGDVKYAPAVGLLSSYINPILTYFSFMLALFIGSIYGITLMILKLKDRKSKIAFGPFMFIGCYLTLLSVNL